MFTSLVLSMAEATKKRKEEAYPWKAGASSGHITNLKQSILETYDIYGSNLSVYKHWLSVDILNVMAPPQPPPKFPRVLK